MLAAGNLIGTCGEGLTTRGAPSGEAWLFSVSISRMNFSASMGVASLVSLGAGLIPGRGEARIHCDSYKRSSEGYADSPKKNGQHTCSDNGSYSGG